MTLSPQFSSEFINRFKAVTEAPDNFKIKAETISMLMQMKALAINGDAMAQYRLAHAYPKNSNFYQSWMQASANQGFTNAMLALSLIYAEHGTVSGLRQAAAQIVQILASNDSYIKSEAKALMERNHLLSAEVSKQLNKTSFGSSTLGFFAQASTPSKQNDVELIEAPKI
ncbi:MAG: hypothetical protein H0U57_06580 [Tatlockia sp.]|nr:hypothetical protein [Tatlockia sp.]